MSQVPSENTSPFPRYPLAQMVRAPLTGQQIGLNDSSFLIDEWTDPGSPAYHDTRHPAFDR